MLPRSYIMFFFFFQAEDRIRDLYVTGVQTCALPISAPARTITSLIAELLDDLRDVGRRDVQPVAVVDRDDGRPAAAADALDRAQGEGAVRRRLAGPDLELGLERGQNVLSTAEPAADVRADLDEPPTDGLQMEHVIEGRDAFAVRRRQIQSLRDLLERLRRQPAAVPLLCDPQRRHYRRARLRILLGDHAHHVRECPRHQRSTSPINVSSEPTIAIRSAMYAPCTVVAVAARAANDGARNFTRHGRGPPSETM